MTKPLIFHMIDSTQNPPTTLCGKTLIHISGFGEPRRSGWKFGNEHRALITKNLAESRLCKKCRAMADQFYQRLADRHTAYLKVTPDA